jgi:hypothetical protein
MNLSMWSAIREYVAAEIKLGIARHVCATSSDPMVRRVMGEEEIPTLQEQSTRMESEVREYVKALETEAKRTRHTNLMNTRFK